MEAKISTKVKDNLRLLFNVLRRKRFHDDAWICTMQPDIRPEILESFKNLSPKEIAHLKIRSINNAHINYNYDYNWLVIMAKARKTTPSAYLTGLLKRLSS